MCVFLLFSLFRGSIFLLLSFSPSSFSTASSFVWTGALIHAHKTSNKLEKIHQLRYHIIEGITLKEEKSQCENEFESEMCDCVSVYRCEWTSARIYIYIYMRVSVCGVVFSNNENALQAVYTLSTERSNQNSNTTNSLSLRLHFKAFLSTYRNQINNKCLCASVDDSYRDFFCFYQKKEERKKKRSTFKEEKKTMKERIKGKQKRIYTLGVYFISYTHTHRQQTKIKTEKENESKSHI